MARSKLFQYAVIYHPQATKDQRDAGNAPKSIVLTEITSIVAKDEKSVGMIVARGLGEEYLDKLDDVEILIRPF